MDKNLTAIDLVDNGGRRRIRDRRFLVTVPYEDDRRTNWERRSGYDRRLRRVLVSPEDRRLVGKRSVGSM